MASLAFAVQKAVDAKLQPVLAALTPPVPLFDHVPPGQTYPFVQFARCIDMPGDLIDRKDRRVQLALAVYSDFRGQEQVLEILAAIEGALDDATLTLATGSAVRCDLDRADSARDQDGVTYTGTALYTVLALG